MKNEKFILYTLLQEYNEENDCWIDLGEAETNNKKQMSELMRLMSEYKRYKRNDARKTKYRLFQKAALSN